VKDDPKEGWPKAAAVRNSRRTPRWRCWATAGSLIIRDMMLQGARTYKTPLECYEGIATNVLASACVAYEIITTKPTHPTTAR